MTNTATTPRQPDLNLEAKLGERFEQLPQVVQDAILSSDVEKNLRALADTHKLHLDQWDALENEVMLALLGFEPMENLAKNLSQEVRVPEADAATLAANISRLIFEPIRESLERSLGNPHAKPEAESDIDKLRDAVLAGEEKPTTPPAPLPVPSTPPSPKPEGVAARAPSDGAYKPGGASSERRDVHDDPYREQP